MGVISMIVSLIAAASINGVIGMDEVIPWHIPGEQKRFKELTLGKSIIMGRKT
jgi:dihydrofolate reductase